MCGIFAILKSKKITNIYQEIIDGLIQLQNRGYDSSGISLFDKKNNVLIHKYASDQNTSSIEKLQTISLETEKEMCMGIGHNRWATHGSKTDINAHPHCSNNTEFTLVHNGIIENYKHLKTFLIENGFSFYSSTDTEVIVNLLQFYYEKGKNIHDSIKKTIDSIHGTYGLIIACKDYPSHLFCVRNGSPIIIGTNEDSCIVTSEQSGFCNKVQSYITLNNDDICEIYIEKEEIMVKTSNQYHEKNVNILDEQLTPAPYSHWTLKEIYEQPSKILASMNFGGRILDDSTVKLGGLDRCINILKDIENMILLGCGTSYHSCMIGKEFLKKCCDFNMIQIMDGSDFEASDIPLLGKTAVVFVSQSGETRDLSRCLDIVKSTGTVSIGIINVVDSLIAKEVDCGIYCNSGRENGVASTKAFTNQVVCFALIAIWFSQVQDLHYSMRKEFIKDLRNLSLDFENCIKNINTQIENSLNLLEKSNSLFILGKQTDEGVAREGSLKIKEISYLHSEAYSSSSLKHGPFALLDENMPVIILNTILEFENKVLNCYEEVKSRGSKIIYITNKKEQDKDNVIIIPYNKTFSSLLAVIPLQLIAYNLSIRKGINPDRPKNLAKVVTVE
uniref:glutamine--fructose-6-phosphate transaminase (isomerizing) n=1 Tax=viral metagenome TaxID=1070528 RepID=A0A6C0CPH4_9ZZZZ